MDIINIVNEFVQFIVEHKWTIVVFIPVVLAIIIIKMRG